MLRENSMEELRNAIQDYGGEILWENNFQSWTEIPQQEIIGKLWGCIIYAQTQMGYLQPCWVHCEHHYSRHILTIANNAKKHFIKCYGGLIHTVFQFYPKELIQNLKLMKDNLKINEIFQIIPNYKLFHILNHSEVRQCENDRYKIVNLTLLKMREAKLGRFVSKIQFVPQPEVYQL